MRDGAAIGRNSKGFDMANIIRTMITRICHCVRGSTYMHKGVVYSVPRIILQSFYFCDRRAIGWNGKGLDEAIITITGISQGISVIIHFDNGIMYPGARVVLF